MVENRKEYIPALSFRVLTPFYDFIQKWVVRDYRYKDRLITQADIQPGQRVLDLGCGTGTLAISVKERQPEALVTGLDADQQMLNMARYKSRKAGVEVKFDEGMTFDLPYPDASIDRILSSIMIHHLKTPDKLRTAKEVQRVLKPGGQLHVVDFGKPVTFYGKVLAPFLHEFEEANDNIDGRLPEIFGAPGLHMEIKAHFWTFFGDLSFLAGFKSK